MKENIEKKLRDEIKELRKTVEIHTKMLGLLSPSNNQLIRSVDVRGMNDQEATKAMTETHKHNRFVKKDRFDYSDMQKRTTQK